MKLKKRRKVIISLILDDLIHAKLLEGLKALCLQPEDYYIDVGDKVIKFMGFKGSRNELIYEHYLNLRKRARLVDLSKGNQNMKTLATEIYQELRLKKSIK